LWGEGICAGGGGNAAAAGMGSLTGVVGGSVDTAFSSAEATLFEMSSADFGNGGGGEEARLVAVGVEAPVPESVTFLDRALGSFSFFVFFFRLKIASCAGSSLTGKVLGSSALRSSSKTLARS